MSKQLPLWGGHRMEKEGARKGDGDGRIAVFAVLLFYIALVWFVPPVYALNDDVQIASILSGTYSGTPDMHTVYMRAPLSFVLSSLYRIIPSVSWLGVLQIGCVALCSAVLFMQWVRNQRLGILTAAGVFVFFMLGKTLLPHYTCTAAVAGGTGLYLLLSGYPLLSVVFFLLCDQIRSQVFMMLGPFILLAFTAMLPEARKKDRQAGQRKESGKLAIAAMSLLLGYGILFLVHGAAYSAPEWKEYLALNEARTQLYDYTGVWESEEAREYYRNEPIGLSETAYPLYRHYDLLPDEEADTGRLQAMAAFREPSRQVSFQQHLKNVLYDLRVRSLDKAADLPYMLLLLVLYFSCITGLIRSLPGKGKTGKDSQGKSEEDAKDSENRKEDGVDARFCSSWNLMILIACMAGHVLLYGWLLWRGRTPERVTWSLYFLESAFLLGMLERIRRAAPEKNGMLPVFPAVAMLLLSLLLPFGEYKNQLSVNEEEGVLYSYMAERPEILFVCETSAGVYRTCYALTPDAQDAGNTVLMGGWMYGSPLQEQKLHLWGIDSREEVFSGPGCCFVFRKDTALKPEQLQAFCIERFGEEAAGVKEVARLSSEVAEYHFWE